MICSRSGDSWYRLDTKNINFEAKFIIILKDLIKFLFYDLKFNKLIRKNPDSIYNFIDNLSVKLFTY